MLTPLIQRDPVAVGHRFGRLVADLATSRRVGGSVVWECTCDCGRITLKSAKLLRAGDARSCGCLFRDYHAGRRVRSIEKLNSPAFDSWKPDAEGYVRTQMAGRTILQHRWLMEGELGRELRPEETVHHKNGVRHDNRPENLELWSRSHPSGQRVEDKVAWATEILALYRPELLQV